MATEERVPGKPVVGQRAIIAKAFKKLAQSEDMQYRWVSCETWAIIINQRSTIGTNITVNGGTVARSLSSDPELQSFADIYSGTNLTGYFRVVYKKTTFYYVCKAGESVLRPKLTPSWYDEVTKNQFIQRTRSREALSGSTVMSVADSDAVSSRQKKKRRTSSRRKSSRSNLPEPRLLLDALRQQTYFDSPEAEILFKPTEDETVLDAIDRRIEVWQSVNETSCGWKNMLAGDKDYEFCTAKHIHRLKQQAVMLVQAYHIAKEEMVAGKSTWNQCCEKSVKMANRVGHKACTI
jgi:hypothetical protein